MSAFGKARKDLPEGGESQNGARRKRTGAEEVRWTFA